MVSQNISDKLNAQITLEFFSSNLYLQMGAWCTWKGYTGAARFLLVHAQEEYGHMSKLFHYLGETGGLAVIDAIEKPQPQFESLLEVFTLIMEHEKLVTLKINDLVDTALQEKDFSTFNFLQWYVAEQHEEESLFSGILDKIRMIGAEGRGLYLIDKEIGKYAVK
jgi:ferritin